MRKLGYALLFGLTVTSCSPSKEKIKQVIRENPDLVFGAIEDDPEKFVATVNQAVQSQQLKARERENQKALTEIEKDFISPKEPIIDKNRIVFGSASAPITIVEYGDLQCPACQRGYYSLKEIKKRYADKISIIYKHMPLKFHELAFPAAQYFEAIARQDKAKALTFHDQIFEKQREMTNLEFIRTTAKALKVDWKRLEKDLKSLEIEKRISDDIGEFTEFGFTGTPVYLINGVALQGAYPADEMAKVIDRHLQKDSR
ncbi:MAG: DsbA family protein [Bdellovibrionaceae bacterium]|nr:DsbA family protein [Bdellovibrionales bacterium]MCB9085554.1 DsbA family protein [Pseudobdellovibrionaceae bacterium]